MPPERVSSHEPADPWAGGGLEFPGLAGAGDLSGVGGEAEWTADAPGSEEEDAWLRAEPGDEPSGRRRDSVAAHDGGPFEAAQAAGAKPPHPHPRTHEAVRAEPTPAPQPARADSAWVGSTEQLWPPSVPLEERLPAADTDQPAKREWYQPVPDLGPDDFNWPAVEEADEDQAADQPTEALDDLAPSFAPWRDDHDWQPPALPRFGPPAPAQEQASAPPGENSGESGSFDSDEFLR